MPEETVLAKGLIERIGLKDSISTVKFDGRAEKQVLDIENHTQAVKILLDDLIRFNIIASYDEITGVGHRVVAGGEYFKESALVDEEVIQKVEELLCWLHCTILPTLLGSVPLKNCYQILPVLLYLIPLSIQQCLKKPIVILFQLSTIQKTRFVNMGLTGLAMSM